MRRVLLAERAMFFKFDACRVQLLVFGHRIIAALAVATFERDNFSHYILTCSLKDQTQPLCFCLLLLPSSGRSRLGGTTNLVRGMTLPPASQSRTTILRLYPGAGDGTRTRDQQLGRLWLYHLSYSRLHELTTGIEPVTSSLPRKCSTDWATWAKSKLFLFCLPRSDRCGEGRIRTSEGKASRFTVCPVWPLWNLSVQITNGKRQKGILSLRFLPFYWEPPAGIEPATPSLQVRCSTNWAMVARDKRKDVIFL